MGWWKVAGWIALMVVVATGSVWRIGTCSCYPPHTSSQWTSMLLKGAVALAACGMLVWNLIADIKSARVSR